MKKYKYIIIDNDEPLHYIVRQQIKAYPNFLCIATFSDPRQALLYLQEQEVDLIFLEIEMLEMNGFQFLEALRKHIFVVIFTGYPEKYCLEAHKFYIDKNLIFFTSKAQFSYYLPTILSYFETKYSEREILNRADLLLKNEIQTFPKLINKELVPLKDIVFMKVVGHHIVLQMKQGEEFIVRMTFREVMNFLPNHIFLRINRNVIINIDYVTAFSDITVCIADQHYKISLKMQKEVVKTLKVQQQLLYDTSRRKTTKRVFLCA